MIWIFLRKCHRHNPTKVLSAETHLEKVIDDFRKEIRNDINSLRTWVISLFLGSIGLMIGIVVLGINAIQSMRL